MAKIRVFKMASETNDLPFDPYVQLSLSHYSGDSAGRILLSPRLASDVEIDESVNDLIEQLEKARKKAKDELQKTKRAMA